MSINRLARLRQLGVFQDFTWPSDLPAFGRYNLIYGWNGSGKTTISRIFRDLELRRQPDSGEVTLSISGSNVIDSDFCDVTIPIRVFNRDFIADNVFPTVGEVAPIFVLGKENVEKQKQVAQLKARLCEEQERLGKNKEKASSASKELGKFCKNNAQAVKNTLRSSGWNPYNDYDKRGFEEKAEEMISADDKAAHQLDDEARDRLLTQLRASPKPKLQRLTYRLPDLESLEKTVAELLSTTVVSAAIRSLKDDPELSSWVHTGLELHQSRGVATCLFCDQTMSKARLAALEAHFNEEYERLLRKLDRESTAIENAVQTANDLAIPKAAEFYEDLTTEFELAARALRHERDSVKQVLVAFLRALEDKKTRVFEPVTLEVILPDLASGVVDRLNAVIEKHNQACNDFESRLSSAREQIEADSVAHNLDEFVKLRKGIRTTEADLVNAKKETKRLTDEIEELEREIVEHRQPAEELNEDLRKYLGHDELRLQVKETGYAIMRHDLPARLLSEGETTAIALLYFLKALQDRRFDLRNGVVVLDDPVSSLDANALYLAFGFIRERTQDAGQLFIFTHNFTFFRQVRNWFHHLKGQRKEEVAKRPARFYMLDCVSNAGTRCSFIRPLDPLLEQYESEYHYLFARIFRRVSSSGKEGLEESYIFPNMARRLLETFLAFRQPDKPGELWQKLKEVEFDETKKLRMIRFLHTHSHGDAIGRPEHDPSLLGEANSVLQDLLDLIRDQDRSHFDAMVRLVEYSKENDGNVETTP